MNPKEKAIEIYNKHYIALFDSESDKGEEILISELAYQNAIITIDYIILYCYHGEIDYWLMVKKELDKMRQKQFIIDMMKDGENGGLCD